MFSNVLQETIPRQRRNGLQRGRKPKAILGFAVDQGKSAAEDGVLLMVLFNDEELPEREAVSLPSCLAHCRDLTLDFCRRYQSGIEKELEISK